ncbi:methylmalonyl-CoA mutase subunit beta [Flavobacterium agricola]|uniref:Methylmalonyl-CoA mutase subunit beta n=1 Tax=Flavobacterium agricola TaxID=2870839 RepID=A0ABY6LY27_9FLAO|nr:methylmalonyl-CoA mutase subunit beta [Flavobacterium agricola]UYW00315.1 methylmalonyl-CoA mutase subunit beta [Flavobacterium agricola]
MDQKLFSDFEPVLSKQWKNLIQYDLKGADYNETLLWETPEGFKVKPFYHHDEFGTALTPNTKVTEFRITQDIYVHDFQKSVYKANQAVVRGAESLKFIIPNAQVDAIALLTALENKNLTIYLDLKFLDTTYITKLDQWLANQRFQVYILTDVVGYLAENGVWYNNQETDFKAIINLSQSIKNCNFIAVNASLYQNAGATCTQQLAFALAHVNEYFNAISTFNQTVVIEIAVGTNYFFEIAKLRALRILFDALNQTYNTQAKLHIFAFPTKRNKTIYDYNTNMLRTTTECMSAIIGGADAVMNLPYDALFHKNNEFGDRIARNQLLILKNESYLDKVNNPADGAYYIEFLTQILAENALELFKKIESHNGFIAGLLNGAIQKQITEAATKEQELFDAGKEVLLGTNKYPNPADKMLNDLELFPFNTKQTGKKVCMPVVEKRLAEKVEQERLALEKQEQ